MNQKEYQEKMNSIQEKIGKDSANLILDDIAMLINDNKQMNENELNKDKEIENLKKTNETLQTVNGNLLQQISVGTEDQLDKNKNKEEKKEKPKYIDFSDCFDENGNFKR